MWLTFNNFWVSALMIRRLSSLNFLLLWTTGLTLVSMVNLWQRKSGSISGISAEDNVNALMFQAITSAIWSCNLWSIKAPSLNIFLSISRSCTSPAGAGRYRLPTSVSNTLATFPPCTKEVEFKIILFFSSHNIFEQPSGST